VTGVFWVADVCRCIALPGALGSCSDGRRNGGEAGVDCGGICPVPCPAAATPRPVLVIPLAAGLGVLGFGLCVLCLTVLPVLVIRRQRARRLNLKVSCRHAGHGRSDDNLNLKVVVNSNVGGMPLAVVLLVIRQLEVDVANISTLFGL
jgi:hypothetical protein